MALVFDSRFRALDSSGNAYSGALLYVYDANTLNLASIYTTSALSVALSNPVVADSAGRFAQIFAVEAATFDMVLKTSAGVLLTSYDDVVAMGANTSIITRDFTNSRLRIAGAGGIISVEAGDPTGDDVGGQLRLGGYSGSQADSLSLDALATNTTGKFTENSKKLPGIVYTPATTVASASEGIITLPNDPVGCVAYDVDVWDLVQTASATMRLQLAFAGGAFKSGVADYGWQYNGAVDTATNTSSDNADVSINMKASGQIGATNQPGWLRFRIITVRSGNNGTTVNGSIGGMLTGGASIVFYSFHGVTAGTYGAADRVRLDCSSGNLGFKYRVTPLRGFGET